MSHPTRCPTCGRPGQAFVQNAAWNGDTGFGSYCTDPWHERTPDAVFSTPTLDTEAGRSASDEPGGPLAEDRYSVPAYCNNCGAHFRVDFAVGDRVDFYGRTCPVCGAVGHIQRGHGAPERIRVKP